MRLFFGIPVSEEVKQRIQPLAEAFSAAGADLKIVSLENLHLTVKFLGEVAEERVVEISEKAAGLLWELHSFSVELEGVGAFPDLKRIEVVWVGLRAEELAILMRQFNETFNEIRRDDFKEMVPHLTLARVSSGKNQEELQKVLLGWQGKEFGKMNVEKVVLYQSNLTPRGPVYTSVKEFFLRDKN